MSTLQARAVSLVVSPRLARLRRSAADLLARARRQTPVLTLYYEPGDAYSHLCAQLLGQLRARLDMQINVVVVPWVADATNAAPALSPAYGIADAQRIAPAWGLRFSGEAQAPPENLRTLAARVLLNTNSLDDFLTVEPQVANALWANDQTSLQAMPLLDVDKSKQRLADNYAQRQSRGHYQGGMWYFRGDWYWALDRLPHLEARLRALDLVRGNAPLARLEPGNAVLPALKNPGELQLFYSFRSPYSYLAIDGARELAARYQLALNIRPVLPMVMRGFKVPQSKRLYIVRDCKREADRLNIPFGVIADPLGGGVERCLAAFEFAEREGKADEFIHHAGRAVWAQGQAIKQDRVLRKVLKQAGLDPAIAKHAPAEGVDLSYAERNREALFELGLWGVPSFACCELAVWGQDRLWLLDEALRRATH